MLVTRNPHGLQEGAYYLEKLREEICPRYCEHIENLLAAAKSPKNKLPKNALTDGIDLALEHARADYVTARYKFPVQMFISKLEEERSKLAGSNVLPFMHHSDQIAA
jgi:hypothetical protein